MSLHKTYHILLSERSEYEKRLKQYDPDDIQNQLYILHVLEAIQENIVELESILDSSQEDCISCQS